MILGNYPGVLYGVSTVSDGNMSFVRGNPQEALQNRQQFLKKLSLDINSVVAMSPQHGVDIKLVSSKDLGKGSLDIKDAFKVDGLITNTPGVNLFLVTADCLPISIYDPVKKAVGLFHAGRVGLYKGILTHAVNSMVENFGSDPKDLVATIGPSIGPCCYTTVFEELHRHHINFVDYFNNEEWKPFAKIEGNKVTLDLWRYTEVELERLGILPDHIENHKICTYHNANPKYYSHRQFENNSLSEDYRFATVIGLNGKN